MAAGLVGGIATLAYVSRGPSESKIGSWLGFRDVGTDPEADPAVLKTLAKVDLRILKTGRFSLFESGLPKTGTVRYGNGMAYLEIEEIAGRPLRQQSSDVQAEARDIELSLVAKSLKYHDPSKPSLDVTLERKPPSE